MQKIQSISSFCSRDAFYLNILQSYWSRTIEPISLTPYFSQIWDLCKNMVIDINFHYKSNSEKNYDQTFR